MTNPIPSRPNLTKYHITRRLEQLQYGLLVLSLGGVCCFLTVFLLGIMTGEKQDFTSLAVKSQGTFLVANDLHEGLRHRAN